MSVQIFVDMDATAGQPCKDMNECDTQRLQHAERLFTHRGLAAEEWIFPEWNEGWGRVIWCRAPFAKMVVGCKPNPLIHADFPRGDPAAQARATAAVQAAFEKHWTVLLSPLADFAPAAGEKVEICTAAPKGTWRDRPSLL